jgi:hypothetical protein
MTARVARRRYPQLTGDVEIESFVFTRTYAANAGSQVTTLSPAPCTLVDTVTTAGTYQYVFQVKFRKINAAQTNLGNITIQPTFDGITSFTPINLLALVLKR